MLLEYGLKNFFAFREGAIVSFRFDGNTPESIAQGRPCATIMGVNGANAAGKTHLLKGLNFLNWFCVRSFAWKPDAKLPIESFGGSKEPSEFFAEFTIGELTYRYECSVTEERVCSEALYRTKAKRTLLFERKENTITHSIKELHALHALTLRSNVSVIATVNQYQLKILQDVFGFFEGIFTSVTCGGRHGPLSDMNEVSEFLFKSHEVREFVEDFITSCDAGISKINIYQRPGAKSDDYIYFPAFVHVIDGKEHEVRAHEESSGTKRLYRTLHEYMFVLAVGGVLAVDEIDMHLHPHILPKLLNLFVDSKINSNNAQLIFTSHDSQVMDRLGRYRSYIVTKRDNESFAFRLDEVPGDLLRNDRLISPVYEDGKIGGVPRL